ncbi:MAG: serine acetyltransferase [Prevotella sp.]|nr:serine acetyltransferase [Prevotella sp.]
MNKRKFRDILRFAEACLFSWLYMPHLIVGGGNFYVKSDVYVLSKQISISLPSLLMLLYLLHNNRYFRSLFYYRIGPIATLIIGWYRPGDRYFQISYSTKIGKSMLIAHPYATILNAESIGDNFSCIHSTTLGATDRGRPIIGNNVSLGANVTIIGPVHVGNNVIIGAGSVVVKDVPSNCVVAGNPAKEIRRYKEPL